MHTNGDEQQPRRSSGLNWKHWLAIGIVVVLCCGGIAITQFDFSDPDDYIKSNYTRASNLDTGGGRAYTSSLSPSSVADDIDDAEEARNERQNGDTYFLQYKDDIVSVEPYQGGSKILLFDYREGYNHYSSVFVLWGWSSSPPSPFRGGGPGSGK